MTLRDRLGPLEAAEEPASWPLAEVHAAEPRRGIEELLPEALRLRATVGRRLRGRYPPQVVEAVVDLRPNLRLPARRSMVAARPHPPGGSQRFGARFARYASP